MTQSLPDGQCCYTESSNCVLAALGAALWQYLMECRETSVQRAQVQPTQLICLLRSFCHHHALDLIPGKEVLAEVYKQ